MILLLAIENIIGCMPLWCSDVQAAACATIHVAIAQAALELNSILTAECTQDTTEETHADSITFRVAITLKDFPNTDSYPIHTPLDTSPP